jgi:hypothetical protein
VYNELCVALGGFVEELRVKNEEWRVLRSSSNCSN